MSKLSRLPVPPRQYRYVVNWGNSTTINNPRNIRVVNSPDSIQKAANKLAAFQILQEAGVRIPQFSTTAPAGVGDIWIARTVLAGSGGQGIVVVRPGEAFPAAPLYTRYIRKQIEVRIHVAFGQAVFLQFKKKQGDAEQTNDQKLIRNYDNGWVFCPRPLETISDDTKEQAVKAVAALGLDFGAVDMVVGKQDNLGYVLEVNTAPGIESPQLLAAYADVFRKELV